MWWWWHVQQVKYKLMLSLLQCDACCSAACQAAFPWTQYVCVCEASSHLSHPSENFTTPSVTQRSLTVTQTRGMERPDHLSCCYMCVCVCEQPSGSRWHVLLLMSQLVSAAPLFILNVSAAGAERLCQTITLWALNSLKGLRWWHNHSDSHF